MEVNINLGHLENIIKLYNDPSWWFTDSAYRDAAGMLVVNFIVSSNVLQDAVSKVVYCSLSYIKTL
jgi:hypothetical protein